MTRVGMKPVELVAALLGAALLVTALFLWAMSHLAFPDVGGHRMNPAAFVVPGTIGLVGCAVPLRPLGARLLHRRPSGSEAPGSEASGSEALSSEAMSSEASGSEASRSDASHIGAPESPAAPAPHRTTPLERGTHA